MGVSLVVAEGKPLVIVVGFLLAFLGLGVNVVPPPEPWRKVVGGLSYVGAAGLLLYALPFYAALIVIVALVVVGIGVLAYQSGRRSAFNRSVESDPHPSTETPDWRDEPYGTQKG